MRLDYLETGRPIIRRRRAALAFVAVVVALIAGACGGATGKRQLGATAFRLPPTMCTRYAAPSGRNHAAGTRAAPLRTVQALLRSLDAGETGCLETGAYREDVTFRRGGTASSPVTLAAVPGARARLVGTLWVARGANWVTVRGLALDGSAHPNVPSPQVNANHTTFYEVDVTNRHTGICFVVGGSAATYGVASQTTIARSRIHGCGRLPRTHLDHGIYLAHSRGATVVDNVVYDNADWGLHLYPDAQDSDVQYNVIDGNGEGVIVSGTDDEASSGNYIAHNIVSNATDRTGGETENVYGYLVTSYWGGRVGRANLVEDNCLWNGAAGTVDNSNGGFSAHDNVVAKPRYVSRVNRDFRLRRGSPCAGHGPRPDRAEVPARG
jgi:parallel beta-helix repeat protein